MCGTSLCVSFAIAQPSLAVYNDGPMRVQGGVLVCLGTAMRLSCEPPQSVNGKRNCVGCPLPYFTYSVTAYGIAAFLLFGCGVVNVEVYASAASCFVLVLRSRLASCYGTRCARCQVLLYKLLPCHGVLLSEGRLLHR